MAYSTSEPVAPVKGSNTGSVVADKSQSDAAARRDVADRRSCHPDDSARSLQKLSEAIAQAPVVNAAKVASVKQAVQ